MTCSKGSTIMGISGIEAVVDAVVSFEYEVDGSPEEEFNCLDG